MAGMSAADVLVRGSGAVGLAAALGGILVMAVVMQRRTRRANLALRAHNDELAYVSLHDRVTGLPNQIGRAHV